MSADSRFCLQETKSVPHFWSGGGGNKKRIPLPTPRKDFFAYPWMRGLFAAERRKNAEAGDPKLPPR